MLRTFTIIFDQIDNVYEPGDLVTGKVVIDFTQTVHINALKLIAKGEANVHWVKGRASNKTEAMIELNTSQKNGDHYTAREEYLSFETCLLGCPDGDASDKITSGYHAYAFQFSLPEEIPCSFEGDFGYVRYTVKAVIVKQLLAIHETKTAFSVIKSLNLNNHVKDTIAINDRVTENYLLFCFLDQGFMNADVLVPTSAYVPGQRIQVKIKFVVDSPSVNVKRVSANLEQIATYHSQLPIQEKKCSSYIVAEEANTGPFSKKRTVVLRILVPPVPPSNLQHCSLIELTYRLNINIEVSRYYHNSSVSYPILIGTIPLRVTALNVQEYECRILPTAPVIDYDEDNEQMQMLQSMTNKSTERNSSALKMIAITHSSVFKDRQWASPCFEECSVAAKHIRDEEDSPTVRNTSNSFAPRYPVYKKLMSLVEEE